MAIVITAAAVVAPPRASAARAVQLAGEASLACLAEARLSPDAVGVLINVGVYREHNTFEPAVGALVQKEAGINLDYLAHPVPGAAFSFDLMNGACGVLNAVQVAESMLVAGGAERVLVTAADVHPGGRGAPDAEHPDDDYPYADLGAALLLERSATADGFGPVRTGGSDDPSATAGYLPTAGMRADGRNRITVRRDPGFATQLLDLAADTALGYVRDEGLDLRRTLVIGSRPTSDFGLRLAGRLGLPEDRVLTPDPPGAGAGLPHTAAPILGYLRAITGGLPEDVDQLLFVAVGAGPSAACVSYRPQERWTR
ncbi:hypothetical protein AB0D08_25290 [Kitasatospora sp. NPDC048540]|uniref:hypothetical protein n=1 Tax=unclassified Kitasatospora TaxID=2633591 RepID=UPI00053B5D91|nr:hypothetical protein [Kitasatospora sp. MBT63]